MEFPITEFENQITEIFSNNNTLYVEYWLQNALIW